MDGQTELVSRLASWATGASVMPTWVRGVLRLQSPDGTAKGVVTFPPAFWNSFATASDERQKDALNVIVADVQALYDPNWKQFEAKNIEVHSTLLKEF